jgi:hypothetical protein
MSKRKLKRKKVEYHDSRDKYENQAIDWNPMNVERLCFKPEVREVLRIYGQPSSQLNLSSEIQSFDGELCKWSLGEIYLTMKDFGFFPPESNTISGCDLGAGRGKPGAVFVAIHNTTTVTNQSLQMIGLECKEDAVLKSLEIRDKLPQNVKERTAFLLKDLLNVNSLSLGTTLAFAYDCRWPSEVTTHVGNIYSNSKGLKYVVSFIPHEEIKKIGTYPNLKLLGNEFGRNIVNGHGPAAASRRILYRRLWRRRGHGRHGPAHRAASAAHI